MSKPESVTQKGKTQLCFAFSASLPKQATPVRVPDKLTNKVKHAKVT